MADPNGIGGNLDTARQLLDAIHRMASGTEQVNRNLRDQSSIFDELLGSITSISDLSFLNLENLPNTLKTAGEAMAGLGVATIGAKAAMAAYGASSEGVFGMLKAAFSSVTESFLEGSELLKGIGGNIVRMGSGVLGTLLDIGKGIFSAFEGIVADFANNVRTGTDPFREALEELRDKFGSLKVGTAKATRDMMENVNQFNESGLKLSRVFGYGRQGSANILREFTKVAEEAGDSARYLYDATKDISGQLLLLTKSTGLSGAALKSLVISANNGGESVKSATQGLTRDLARAQKTFGISVKEMGKDLEVMMKDVGSFGIMTRETMIRTSVYVKKLGISMETLKKVMDKTLNFEDAAAMAAGLAESFNMNVDAFKLMQEQDPVKKIDMLRDSFFKTGKNVDQLNRAELKHLATLSNMTEEEVRMAYSQKFRALTGNQLDAQMKKSQKQHMSQEEAMEALSDSIKRLVQSMSSPQFQGFFDAFSKGFSAGILNSREFQEVARELNSILRQVFRTGREVARLFIDYFPGVQEIFAGLRQVFNPSNWASMLGKVRNAFEVFFKDLTEDPEDAVTNFIDKISKAFTDLFNDSGPGGSMLLSGLTKFWSAVKVIIFGGLRWMLEKVRDGISSVLTSIRGTLSRGGGILDIITDLFSGTGITKAADVATSGIGSIFADISSTFRTMIWPVLQDIVKLIVDFFKDPTTTNSVTSSITGALSPDGAQARGIGASLVSTVFSDEMVDTFSTKFTDLIVIASDRASSQSALVRGFLSLVDRFAPAYKQSAEAQAVFARRTAEQTNALQGVANAHATVQKASQATAQATQESLRGISQAAHNAHSSVQNVARQGAGGGAGGAQAVQAAKGAAQARQAVESVSSTKLTNSEALGEAFDKMNEILTRLSSFIKDSFKDFTPEQINSMKGGIELVTSGLGLINSMVATIKGMHEVSGGETVYSTFIEPLISDNGILTYLFNEKKHSQAADFKNMFKKGGLIEAFANSMPDNAVAQLGKITNLFNFVKGIAETIKVLNDATSPEKGIYGTFISPLIDRSNGILPYLFDESHAEAIDFKNMFKKDGLVDKFAKSMPNNSAEEITKITSIFQFIKGIAETLGSLKGLASPDKSIYESVIKPLIDFRAGILPYFFDEGHGEAIAFKNMFKKGGLIDNFAKAMPDDSATKVQKIKTLFDGIKGMAEVIKQIKDIPSEPVSPESLDTILSNISIILGTFLSPTLFSEGNYENPLLINDMGSSLESMTKNLRTIKGKFTDLKTNLTDFMKSFSTLRNLEEIYPMQGLTNSISVIEDTSIQLQNAFGSQSTVFSDRMQDVTKNIKGRLMEDVKTMVKQYNAFSRELANLGDIDIDSTIKAVGQNLSHDRQITLDRAAANVTINLSVKLTAEDIEKALYARVDSGALKGSPGRIKPEAFTPMTGDKQGAIREPS